MPRGPRLARAGLLTIDHRDSPGVPVEALPAHVPISFAIAAGKILEIPTLTCTDCGALVVLNPERERPRNYCAKCDGYVCDVCAAATAAGAPHRCFEQTLDLAYEAAVRGR